MVIPQMMTTTTGTMTAGGKRREGERRKEPHRSGVLLLVVFVFPFVLSLVLVVLRTTRKWPEGPASLLSAETAKKVSSWFGSCVFF